MEILNRYTNACLWEGEANDIGAAVNAALAEGANLRGANLEGANLEGANLEGANLEGANGQTLKVARMRVFSGLYRYQVWAVATADGTPWVRMGCLWKPVEEWDRIGIRASNPREFPDDESELCEDRVRAFEFARDAAMRDAEFVRAELASAQ